MRSEIMTKQSLCTLLHTQSYSQLYYCCLQIMDVNNSHGRSCECLTSVLSPPINPIPTYIHLLICFLEHVAQHPLEPTAKPRFSPSPTPITRRTKKKDLSAKEKMTDTICYETDVICNIICSVLQARKFIHL